VTDTLVLAYHAVSSSWQSSLAVDPVDLAWQVDHLLGRGYRAVRFIDAVSGSGHPGKRFAITFDDAYASVFEHARPVLAKRGVPATVFAPTAFIGTGKPMSWPGIEQWSTGPHAAELTPMSWEQLAELRDSGWEVGSHTVTHPRLTELDDAALAAQLGDSRATCEERLRGRCESLAFPYGDHDPRVVEAAGRAGYLAACTLPARLHRAEPLRWPRIGVYPVDRAHWRIRLKLSPLARRLRGSVLWP
jgi:peptidoglycan/xylan/chitin deacetylase (PgdA/CDA1 family)